MSLWKQQIDTLIWQKFSYHIYLEYLDGKIFLQNRRNNQFCQINMNFMLNSLKDSEWRFQSIRHWLNIGYRDNKFWNSLLILYTEKCLPILFLSLSLLRQWANFKLASFSFIMFSIRNTTILDDIVCWCKKVKITQGENKPVYRRISLLPIKTTGPDSWFQWEYLDRGWARSDDGVTQHLAFPHGGQLTQQRAGVNLIGVKLLVTVGQHDGLFQISTGLLGMDL